MAQRSLNKAQLIGNLTRDPELRYTPQGTAVCTFGLATNRGWTTDTGEKREETEFHRLVAWNKLAEICSQLLFKGRRIFVEGRLQTRQWTAKDGTPRQTTEIVVSDMLILDSKRTPGEADEGFPEEPSVEEPPAEGGQEKKPAVKAAPAKKEKSAAQAAPSDNQAVKKAKKSSQKSDDDQAGDEEVKPEDIPF